MTSCALATSFASHNFLSPLYFFFLLWRYILPAHACPLEAATGAGTCSKITRNDLLCGFVEMAGRATTPGFLSTVGGARSRAEAINV